MPAKKSCSLPSTDTSSDSALVATGPTPGTPKNAGDPAVARECFERLRELSRSKDERIALAACKELLDRVCGKPEQAHRFDAEGAGMVVVIREGLAGGRNNE